MRYRILNFLLFVIRSYIRNKCHFCNDFCNDIEILDLISHQNIKRGKKDISFLPGFRID